MPEAPHALHLAVALDGAGWHPASWREPGNRPDEVFTAGYWVDLVQKAARGGLDFVTVEDGLSLQSEHPVEPDGRTDRFRGRLDAVLTAARAAPLTSGIGLVPTVTATHTEPFHVSKAIATLDYVSLGRAGVQIRVSARSDEAAHVGRRSVPASRADAPTAARVSGDDLLDDPFDDDIVDDDLFDEAADYVEVLRRLWDSWEDDAEIRDVATGRFVDREKLHYIDFQGRWFSVRGPSITPRPPQGQPVVSAPADTPNGYRFLARSADVGYLSARGPAEAAQAVEQVRRQERAVGREPGAVRLLADLVVVLEADAAAAQARWRRLEGRAGRAPSAEVPVFVGTPAELADELADWRDSGVSGFRLRPAVLPYDLARITRDLVPILRARGVLPDEPPSGTLRERLGLGRPASRYVTQGAS